MKKQITIKELFENDSILITNIMQGYSGNVRIDARRMFFKPGHENSFSEWCSKKYADKLAKENYGKKVSDLSCYSY